MTRDVHFSGCTHGNSVDQAVIVSDQEDNSGAVTWIRKNGYQLSEMERTILAGNEWLNSDIMDAAQFIIACYLGSAHQSVIYCRKPEKFIPVDSDNLQLIHNGKDHWILTRSTNGQVQIFDSLRKSNQNSFTRRSIQCIYALYKTTDGVITADLMNVQRQTDDVNCGIFAIAYAADILSGISPVNSTYDVKKLRSHLVKCLEEETLIPFPKVSTGLRQRKLIESIDVIII